MHARIITDQDCKAWDEYIFSGPSRNSWLLYDWHKVLKSYYGLKFFPIAAIDDGNICGILPIYRVRTIRSGTALISIPYVVSGGILADNDSATHCLLDAAIDLSKQLGDVPITLKQSGRRFAGNFVIDEGYFNRAIDLSHGLDAVWDSIDERNKSAIEAVEGAHSNSELLTYPSEDLKGYYKLLRRFQHANGTPCPSMQWLRLLLETGTYCIATLSEENALVAATLVKKFKGSVSFPYTCHVDTEETSVRYAYYLYWKLLEQLLPESVQIFNTGRVPNDGGVPQYRLGWGGEVQPYYYHYYGLGTRTETTSKRGRTRQIGSYVWKRMPPSVMGLFEATVIRQYP